LWYKSAHGEHHRTACWFLWRFGSRGKLRHGNSVINDLHIAGSVAASIGGYRMRNSNDTIGSPKAVTLQEDTPSEAHALIVATLGI
jgi:hypothetical protein